jgi:hypothetical protein
MDLIHIYKMSILIKEYLLNNYDVRVYAEEDSIELINLAELEDLTDSLENKEYPKQIVESIELINHIKTIEIINKSGDLLLSSTSGIF